MKNEKNVPSRLGPAVSTSAAAAPATTPVRVELRGVGRLELRGPRRRRAALGVADDRGRAVGRELRRAQRPGGAHRVEHVRPERAADHVGVVTRGAEPLVVGDGHRPAAGEDQGHQPRLPVEPAGEQARRGGAVADAVGPDRVADQRPDAARAPARDHHRARDGRRLADRAGRAVQDPPGAGAEPQTGHEVRIGALRPDDRPRRPVGEDRGGRVEGGVGGGAATRRREHQQRGGRLPGEVEDAHGGFPFPRITRRSASWHDSSVSRPMRSDPFLHTAIVNPCLAQRQLYRRATAGTGRRRGCGGTRGADQRRRRRAALRPAAPLVHRPRRVERRLAVCGQRRGIARPYGRWWMPLPATVYQPITTPSDHHHAADHHDHRASETTRWERRGGPGAHRATSVRRPHQRLAQSRPIRWARCTASARLRAPSLRYRALVCSLTVCGERNSRAAISAVRGPTRDQARAPPARAR